MHRRPLTSDLDRCTVNPPTPETALPPATSDAPLPARRGARVPPAPWWLTALFALLALAALWLAWQTTQRTRALEQELVRRQQESQTLATEARVLARQAQ